MRLRYLCNLCALAGVAAAPNATAQTGIRLEQQIFVERVTTDLNGRARHVLTNADRLSPGDQLIFVINWSNQGRQPIRGLAVTNAVRRGVEPDPSSGPSNAAMQVSVDGGAHWGRLDQLWLPTPLGGTRRATAADITHLRWTLTEAVPPGQSGRLSYRATMR